MWQSLAWECPDATQRNPGPSRLLRGPGVCSTELLDIVYLSSTCRKNKIKYNWIQEDPTGYGINYRERKQISDDLGPGRGR